MEQAIGRARAVNRRSPVVLELLSNAIVRHPVEIAEIARSMSKDDPLAEMLAEGGVSIESPAHASQAYPQLWKTMQAAQYALAETGQETSYSHLYVESCPVRVCHRVPRRTETFTAGVDQRQHRDPVAAVRSAIPKAVEVRVIEENKVIRLFRDSVIDLNLALTSRARPHKRPPLTPPRAGDVICKDLIV